MEGNCKAGEWPGTGCCRGRLLVVDGGSLPLVEDDLDARKFVITN